MKVELKTASNEEPDGLCLTDRYPSTLAAKPIARTGDQLVCEEAGGLLNGSSKFSNRVELVGF
jgi:hypothetical protein